MIQGKGTGFSSSWKTLENVEAECTHCRKKMTLSVGGGGAVKYFRCEGCRRTLSSTYTHVLKADAKMRTRPVRPVQEVVPFETVRSRLERFLAAVEEQDPYSVLGVSAMDTDVRIRARYRELALQCHPDRGGTPERMRELNAAYDRIVAHREKQRDGVMPGLRLNALPAT